MDDADQEPVLDPGLPIFDSHHHLWDRPGQRYLIEDLIDDIVASGHRIVGTALVESGAFTLVQNGNYAARAEAMMAAHAAAYAITRSNSTILACDVIVGHVDLRGGVAVIPALQALREAAGGNLRAIRQCGTWDADASVRGGPPIAPPGLYADARFREGLRALQDQGLAFEAWAYQTQHDEVLDLARSFQDLRIVYNHVGGVLGTGPYAGQRDPLYAAWKTGLTALADLPNLHLKLGGLGMERSGLPFFQRPIRPDGHELARAWRPWLEPAIALFGSQRCMFESNFPVDRSSCSYRALWNAFKILSEPVAPAERLALFHDTAHAFYR